LNCLSILGGYYSDVAIAVISTDLMKGLEIGQAEFGLLFSVYSVPNMVMVLFGGILLDKIGLRIGLILYLALIALGTFITAAAPYYENPSSFYVMLLGRFVFGLGAEPAYIANDVVCVRWFKGNTVAFSLSLLASFARVGEIISFNSMAEISHYYKDYKIALWFSFGITVFSLVAGCVLAILDKYGERKLKLGNDTQPDPVRISDVRKFPAAYWVVLLLTTAFYGAIYPFLSFASEFLQYQWKWDEERAGFEVSMLSFVAMIVAPLFGLILDKSGKRGVTVAVAAFGTLIGLVLMAWTKVSPLIIMGIMGVGYALIPAAVIPSLALIIEESHFGTAYGIMMAAANTGLVLFYFVIGLAMDQTSTPELSLMIMAAAAFTTFLLSLLWNYLDYFHMNGLVNKAPFQIGYEKIT